MTLERPIKQEASIGATLARFSFSTPGLMLWAALFAVSWGGENSLISKIYTAWQENGKTVIGSEEKPLTGAQDEGPKLCWNCQNTGWTVLKLMGYVGLVNRCGLCGRVGTEETKPQV